MMEKTRYNGKEGDSLVDIVFSWTIKDALNEDLYQNKVIFPIKNTLDNLDQHFI